MSEKKVTIATSSQVTLCRNSKLSFVAISVIYQITVNPLTPMPAVTSFGLSSTCDVINFDQNWHQLHSTSAGGTDLSNDAQIRVIGVMEPEICNCLIAFHTH